MKPPIGDLTAEYRRSRGWSPDPGPMTRISCNLPRDLVARLNRQARLMDTDRHHLVRAAIEGLVNDFEAIDADEARRVGREQKADG